MQNKILLRLQYYIRDITTCVTAAVVADTIASLVVAGVGDVVAASAVDSDFIDAFFALIIALFIHHPYHHKP